MTLGAFITLFPHHSKISQHSLIWLLFWNIESLNHPFFSVSKSTRWLEFLRLHIFIFCCRQKACHCKPWLWWNQRTWAWGVAMWRRQAPTPVIPLCGGDSRSIWFPSLQPQQRPQSKNQEILPEKVGITITITTTILFCFPVVPIHLTSPHETFYHSF